MSNLNVYMTSLEPNMSQTICSQSIGGYCSTSLLYPSTTLSQDVGLYDTTFYMNPPTTWSDWSGATYLSINNELMEVIALTSRRVRVNTRGTNGIINFHLTGDKVRPVSKKQLFNDSFNSDRKQYRCVAVKNDGVDLAEDISVFIKQNSRSDGCNIKIAIEKPKNKYIIRTSTSRTTISLTDSTLIWKYPDNYFAEAFLKPSGEMGGIVRSFDSDTGTFVFYDSFSSDVTNKQYTIYPAPSQRLKTGTASPVQNSLMTSFSSATEEHPLYLSLMSTNPSSSTIDDLSRENLFYIWIERSIEKGSLPTDNDDFVINVKYIIR